MLLFSSFHADQVLKNIYFVIQNTQNEIHSNQVFCTKKEHELALLHNKHEIRCLEMLFCHCFRVHLYTGGR